MQLYDILNPSDPYTFQAPDREVAALTIFILSTKFGATCLSNPGTDEDVPVFILGGSKQWWDEHFDPDIQARLTARAPELVAALRSTLYGKEQDRKDFDKLAGVIPEGPARIQMRIKWNEEHRTSMNDISAGAYEMADAVEKSIAAVPASGIPDDV